MSYIVEKHYTTQFEIEKVKRNFMKFRAFNNVRKDITGCQLCDKAFQDKDVIHLALVKAQKNQIICDDCASKIIKGGAVEINW